MRFSESDFYIKEYGEEKCKQMDAYYDDFEVRKEKGLEKLVANLPKLLELIKEKTGIDTTFKYKTSKRDNEDVVIEIESEDISKKYPVLGLAWESLVICNFGGGFTKINNENSYYRNEKDFSKPCPEVRYGMTIEYAYSSYSGGTNGTNIGWAEASEKTNWEWNFVLNKE